MERNIASGYHKECPKENIVLEPEDWSSNEWETLCKLCGLPAQRTERVVLHLGCIEYYVSSDEQLEKE